MRWSEYALHVQSRDLSDRADSDVSLEQCGGIGRELDRAACHDARHHHTVPTPRGRSPAIYLTGNPAPDDLTVTRPLRARPHRPAYRDELLQRHHRKPDGRLGGSGGNETPSPTDCRPQRVRQRLPGLRIPTITFMPRAANCNSPCVQEMPGLAWNHGDVTPDITRTWLGMVGPGIKTHGRDNKTWADHTDIRPTTLALVGLRDDYAVDGRVLFEEFRRFAVSPALLAGIRDLRRLEAHKSSNKLTRQSAARNQLTHALYTGAGKR